MEETENTRKRKRQYSKELLQPPKGPGLCRSQKHCKLMTELAAEDTNSPTSCGSMIFHVFVLQGYGFCLKNWKRTRSLQDLQESSEWRRARVRMSQQLHCIN